MLGQKKSEKDYPERVGVYGLDIFFDEVKKQYLLAVVEVIKEHKSHTDYHLIGGKMEDVDREDHALALKREFLEETGYDIEIKEYIHRIDEYVDSKTMTFEKIGYYYHVKILEKIDEAKEKNHTLRWIPIEQAVRELHHPSARFIVDFCMRMKGIVDKSEE